MSDGTFLPLKTGVGTDPHTAFALSPDSKMHKEKAEDPPFQLLDSDNMTISIGRAGHLSGNLTELSQKV
uniref:Uncharacterized protein n=1 Tax=Amphilophus citrinellus TaxID=61819 RepID=A0A3Q0T266_AMPCI